MTIWDRKKNGKIPGTVLQKHKYAIIPLGYTNTKINPFIDPVVFACIRNEVLPIFYWNSKISPSSALELATFRRMFETLVDPEATINFCLTKFVAPLESYRRDNEEFGSSLSFADWLFLIDKHFTFEHQWNRLRNEANRLSYLLSEKVCYCETETTPWNALLESLALPPVKIVNLDERLDRFTEMTKKLANAEIFQYNRVPAVDRKLLTKDTMMTEFKLTGKRTWRNPYGTHQHLRAPLACGHSHYKLWKLLFQISVTPNSGIVNPEDEFKQYLDEATEIHWLILEDDVSFVPKFKEKFIEIQEALSKLGDWDILYLGWTDSEFRDPEDVEIIPKLIFQFSGKVIRSHGGGTFAYLLHARGARKLVNLAEKEHIQQSIDWYMFDKFDVLNAFGLVENLVSTPVAGKTTVDSDIQFDLEKIKF
jgi:GR25 family glycosyltransferase involved in LPS biosynthesis